MEQKLEDETKIIEIIKEKEKKAVKEFIGTSSFHGIIQTYYHRRIEKLSWVICLTICLVGFIGHLYLIINRFVGLPTTIDIISSINYDDFPGVTICPIKIISETKLSKFKNQRERKFNNQTINELFNTYALNFWMDFYKLNGNDINDSAIIGKYWDDTETSLYRFQKYMNATIDRRNYEIIFYCEINDKPCSWRDFKEMDHPIHKRCYKFENPYQKEHEIPDKLIIGIYSKDDFLRVSDDIKTIINYYGGFVTINEPTVFPGTDKVFDQFHSGFQTFIRIKQLGNIKVNKKRAPCLTNKNANYHILNNFEYDGSKNVSIPYKYNIILCRQYYQQMECVKNCGCLNPNLPVFTDVFGQSKSDLMFCNELAFGVTIGNVNKNMECINKLDFDVEFNERVIALCFGLCEQTSYTTYSYNMPWFGTTMIKEINFVYEKFTLHYNSLIDSKDITTPDALNSGMECLSESLKLIRNADPCFALLNIQFESPRKEITREYEVYLAGNLLSDFGGILGLWIGVSLVTIIEVIQVSLSLSRHKTKRAASVFKKSMHKRSINRASMKNIDETK